LYRALEGCLTGLPERQRQAVSLRLLDGMAPEELCSALGISQSNLWVLLHRGRLRLWACLDSRGLAPPRSEAPEP
jgi:RNA polymerase sigma-70 factor (ECF subfamily)